jgi:hypothetical protein
VTVRVTESEESEEVEEVSESPDMKMGLTASPIPHHHAAILAWIYEYDNIVQIH